MEEGRGGTRRPYERESSPALGMMSNFLHKHVEKGGRDLHHSGPHVQSTYQAVLPSGTFQNPLNNYRTKLRCDRSCKGFAQCPSKFLPMGVHNLNLSQCIEQTRQHDKGAEDSTTCSAKLHLELILLVSGDNLNAYYL
jgi:hypothetical protein